MTTTLTWARSPCLPAALFLQVVSDTVRVLSYLAEQYLIPVRGPQGWDEPELENQRIAFNGREWCGHPLYGAELAECRTSKCAGGSFREPFVLDQVVRPDDRRCRLPDGSVLESCDPDRRAYGLAVQCVLIIAKHHFGHAITIWGGDKSSWNDARAVCEDLLGFGNEFQPDPEDPKRIPAASRIRPPAYRR